MNLLFLRMISLKKKKTKIIFKISKLKKLDPDIN